MAVDVEFVVLTGNPGFGESRSTWNIKNISPNNAGPNPLHKPRMPVIIPWTAPTVDKIRVFVILTNTLQKNREELRTATLIGSI